MDIYIERNKLKDSILKCLWNIERKEIFHLYCSIIPKYSTMNISFFLFKMYCKSIFKLPVLFWETSPFLLHSKLYILRSYMWRSYQYSTKTYIRSKVELNIFICLQLTKGKLYVEIISIVLQKLYKIWSTFF